MQKLLVTALIAVTTIASAADWRSIEESSDSETRLLVDVDSYNEGKSDGEKTLFASFRYVNNGDIKDPYAGVVFADSCSTGEGQLFLRRYENGSWVTKNKYWWSKSGTKMYDSIGLFLCNVYANKRGASKPSNSKSAPNV